MSLHLGPFNPANTPLIQAAYYKSNWSAVAGECLILKADFASGRRNFRE
jgi:hypothetical protein